MNIKIVTAEQLPDQIETLATLARKEGYNLVDKLIEEYRTGKNCFSHANEYWWWRMMARNWLAVVA